MTEKEFIFDPHNKVERSYGYCMFFVSIISFILTNIVVTKIGPPKNVKGDPWRWNNLFISWIHAAICGTWDILCLYFYPEMLDDLVHHINYFTYLMIAFSTGYFVYDFLDLMYNGKLIANWEVTLHHIAVTSMFWYNLHEEMCIGYNVVAIMAEINSFFLHSRKLLHLLQYKFDNKFYRLVCMLNLVTFFVCRGWSLCRISYGMYTESHRVPPVYFRFLCFSIFVMNSINPVLFWRLLRNDVLRRPSTPKKSKQPVINGNNNQNAHLKSN
ncbi:TLC domain-containing protein 2-like isoform X1 [Ruditapes philippinarum]|uniref:TLC domain-containing protein 2-like n=1 Tax=Ruditapes philippinarum TaxID=129788 RepID=UPI00295B9AE5|nr:TLC domain-containing protein 2-like [Ruditapes philippinarum]XP_060568706.1 TLC domain-containing protein 2-like isoform X1 [Ruditapes philippinarum]